MTSSRGIPIVAILAVGFLAYFPSLGGSFVWDDEAIFQENQMVRSWANAPKIFTQEISAGFETRQRSNFYRPIQKLTYFFDYSIWKSNPLGYHLTSVLLHVLAALCLFRFVQILLKDSAVALWSALLFVAHPVHTEAVAYVSGRADLLAAMFMLLGLIFYLKNKNLWVAVFFALALLSKEYAMIFPVLVLFIGWFFRKKLSIVKMLPCAVVLGLYFLVRWQVTGFAPVELPVETTFWQRLPGFFAGVWESVRVLVWPLGLHMEYGFRIFEWTDARVMAGAGIVVAAIGAIFADQIRARTWSGGLLWFFLALLPQSNLFPLNAWFAEHWLYVPSMGIFILAAKYLLKWKPVLIGLVSVLTLLTFRQCGYWNNPETFYLKTIQHNPDSARLYNNLGNLYMRQGDLEKAVLQFTKGIAMSPGSATIYHNLGHAYEKMAHYADAESVFKKALELDPGYTEIHQDLGLVYARWGTEFCQQGRYREGIELFEKSITLDPNLKGVRENLEAARAQIQ